MADKKPPKEAKKAAPPPEPFFPTDFQRVIPIPFCK